eukprot:1158129-Pelagomonas_calceolata.AAC.5
MTTSNTHDIAAPRSAASLTEKDCVLIICWHMTTSDLTQSCLFFNTAGVPASRATDKLPLQTPHSYHTHHTAAVVPANLGRVVGGHGQHLVSAEDASLQPVDLGVRAARGLALLVLLQGCQLVVHLQAHTAKCKSR